MPANRANKKKSTSGNRKSGSKELATGQGTQSESEPSTKRPRDDPDEGDDSEEDQKQHIDPMTWVKWIKDVKAIDWGYYKSGMDTFSASIEKKTDKTRNALAEQLESRRPDESQTEPILENAFKIATSLRLDDSRTEGDAFFKQAQDVLASSTRLLTCHRETENTLKGMEAHTEVLLSWKKDRKDLKEVLAKGREYGGKIVANHLAPGTFKPSDLDMANAGEHEKRAASMFQDSRQARPEDSWGAAAFEQFEHFRNLAGSVRFAVDADGHDADPDPRRVQ